MKLIRDRIPSIIEEEGQTCKCHTADIQEFEERLYEKMEEEIQEFIEKPCIEEAADMYEVLKTICWLHKLSMTDVMNFAAEKANQRGGFQKAIILEEVK